jgi:hypothetical protein
LIETHHVERVLANIDADHSDGGVEFLRHDVLLVFGAPCQRNLLSGQEHGRTIPLADSQSAAHSITSSARPRSEIGTVMPSAFAVVRLMISSTLVDC